MPGRVTQQDVQVLGGGVAVGRVTQQTAQVLGGGVALGRVTQMVVQVLCSDAPLPRGGGNLAGLLLTNNVI